MVDGKIFAERWGGGEKWVLVISYRIMVIGCRIIVIGYLLSGDERRGDAEERETGKTTDDRGRTTEGEGLTTDGGSRAEKGAGLNICSLGNRRLRVAPMGTHPRGLGVHQNALEAVRDSGGGRVRREVFAGNKLRTFNTRGIEAGGRKRWWSIGLG